MLRKRIDLEIIEILRKEPSHIRAIAQQLGEIPSTISRTIKRLEEDNVVDFKVIGKNKTYFLKEYVEAQQFLFIAEHYKLVKCSTNPMLRRIIYEFKKKTNGELIVLFGSHVKGNLTKKSDIDIFVETENRELEKELRTISKDLDLKIGKLDKENLLTKEIMKDHIIIQNVERFYQLTQ